MTPRTALDEPTDGIDGVDGAHSADGVDSAGSADGDQHDLSDRQALRRVGGLSTELADVTEVEYRQLRLERVVLAGVWSGSIGTVVDAENSLKELAALAETAGSEVLDGVLQRRLTPDPGTWLGSGKAEELRGIVAANGADTVVADGDLSPSQRRSLEDIVKVKVIDRTALILDIFAQHAKSKEGKAQVELAQLEYLLPRLRGWGDSMSRQAGGRVAGGEGIGSRGPGETKIELDRRRIRTRMARLRREIKDMRPARETRRAVRREGSAPQVVIVGYTNAGKSSLLNRLTSAGVLVEDALFATLDPTVRRAETPDGRTITLTDTVGFVRSLPHQLVEAFRSTLEEVAEADLLLHVVDASHPDPEGQIAAVRTVLGDLGLRSSRGGHRGLSAAERRDHGVNGTEALELVVLNKVDAADPDVVDRLQRREPGCALVSARTGQGVEELRALVAELLPDPESLVDVTVPYDRGDLVSRAHTTGQVQQEEHTGAGTHLRARVAPELAAELGAVDVGQRAAPGSGG